MLRVARRVRNHQVGPAIRSAVHSPDAMVHVPAGLFSYRQVAERTLPILFIPQPSQLPTTDQCLHHLLGLTLCKVMFPLGIVGVGFRLDLEVLPVRKIREPQESKTLHGEHPISGAFPAEVAPFDPALALVRVPT